MEIMKMFQKRFLTICIENHTYVMSHLQSCGMSLRQMKTRVSIDHQWTELCLLSQCASLCMEQYAWIHVISSKMHADIINDDEYNALQKEWLMLFEGFCIFGFWEFFKHFFCILMEVNKTIYGNNEDAPKRFLDNLYPESHLCDVTFAVVWNVLAADENKSVNQPSINKT